MRKDIFTYFLGKLVPAFVNLVLIILVVRFLGEDEYGRFSLISYFALLIVQLCFTWIQQSMIRFLTIYKENPSEILSRFFFLTTLSMFAGGVIVLLTGWFYFNLDAPKLAVLVFYTVMFILFVFRLTLYQAFMKPLKYAAYEGIYNFFLLAFLLGFIYLISYRSFMMVFISMGAGYFMVELLHYLFMRDHTFRFDVKSIHHEKGFTKQMMDYGLPLTIWVFISTLTLIADRYIIKEYEGYGAAGTYAAIKDLVTKISTFSLLPVTIAYIARINDAWNSKDFLKAKSLILQAILLELGVGTVVSIVFLLLSNFFYASILHLSGSGLFSTSLFLIASAFLWQAALIFHKPLELLFRQKSMLLLILISLIVNLALNLILVPKYGFRAAAVTSFVSIALYSLLNIIYSKILFRRHEEQNQNNPSRGLTEDLSEIGNF